MAIVVVNLLYCDFCDYPEPSEGDLQPMSVREVRAAARAIGYTFPRINGKTYDRCPECTKLKESQDDHK